MKIIVRQFSITALKTEFALENVGYFTENIPIELSQFVIVYEKKTTYNASQWSYKNSAFIKANQGCVCLAEKAHPI
jgi:hypothetical protein